jgi:hypothetical protein
MPHARRYFISNQAYAITFRVRQGLPFVANRTIKQVLQGALARTQRDAKVVLCHFLWMANHAHLLVLAKDPYELTAFYAELQKKITDSIRSLLGKQHLSLWEGRPVVAYIADLESAISQIVYLYANPARANLERSIESYPGYSSWSLFQASPDTLGAVIEQKVKWTRASSIPKLPNATISEYTDKFLSAKLEAAGIKETLTLYPNAWMSAFKVSSPEDVAEANEKIRRRLKARELELEEKRQFEGRRVLGARALREQSINREHTPAPCERRVYVIASDNQVRVEFIEQFKLICERCYECFCSWLKGCFTPWPPGCFRSPIRHAASAIEP